MHASELLTFPLPSVRVQVIRLAEGLRASYAKRKLQAADADADADADDQAREAATQAVPPPSTAAVASSAATPTTPATAPVVPAQAPVCAPSVTPFVPPANGAPVSWARMSQGGDLPLHATAAGHAHPGTAPPVVASRGVVPSARVQLRVGAPAFVPGGRRR